MSLPETQADPAVVGDDPRTLLLNSRPVLRPELVVETRTEGKRAFAVIEDPMRGRFFQTGIREYRFLQLVDGTLSVADILARRPFGEIADEQAIALATQIINWLGQNNLLTSHGGRRNIDRLLQAVQTRQKQQLLGKLNPVCLKVDIVNPEKLLRWLLPRFRWFFSLPFFCLWLLAGAFSVALVHDNYGKFAAAANGILAPDRWLWLLLVWVGLKFIHELAHGIVCKKYAGDVPRAGVMLLLLAPLFYVDVTSSWRMRNRWHRMAVAAAGMYAELFVAFIAVFVWHFSHSDWVRDIAYNVIVMAGISTVLFNANPLIRFDGYYLLSDGLGITNLYNKGSAWLGGCFRNLVFGFPNQPGSGPRGERSAVAIYGVASFLWRILLTASLLLGASTLLGGFGIVLAAVGAVFWVGLPAINHVRRWRVMASLHPIRPRRLAISSMVLVFSLLACFAWIKAPSVTMVPAVVRFENEKIVRAPSDGFVDAIYITDGQLVAQGEVLVKLANPDLVQELNDLQEELRAAAIRARQFALRGELAQHQAERKRIDALNQSIQEKSQLVDELHVRAPLDGVIYARQLQQLLGSYLKQGDVILRCANPETKEALLSFDQQEAEQVRAESWRPVKLFFPASRVVSTRVRNLNPRASDIPSDITMTAACGGTLPVRLANASEADAQADETYRLIKPRFEGTCRLSPSDANNLSVGQRGLAAVHGRNMSVGLFVIQGCREWIRKKLDVALAQ